MNIVAVDNSVADLSQLVDILAALSPDSKVQAFTDPLMSAKYICNNPVNVVFLMDEMRPANGFKLTRVLRANIPKLPIVMLSASDTNKADAMCAGLDDYLMKPLSAESLEAVMKQLATQ